MQRVTRSGGEFWPSTARFHVRGSGGAGLRRLTGWSLTPGNDVNVDAELTRCPDYPLHVRPAAGELLPSAALAGADQCDLMLTREADDGTGGIVIADLVPAGTDVRRELSQSVQ